MEVDVPWQESRTLTELKSFLGSVPSGNGSVLARLPSNCRVRAEVERFQEKMFTGMCLDLK